MFGLVNWKAISAVLLAIAIVLAGVAGYLYVMTPQASQARSMTFMLEFSPTGRDVPFYAGVDQGYYSSQGLEVSIVASQGSGSTASAVASGTAQMGMVDFGTFLTAVSHHENITAVMLFEDKSGLQLVSLSPIPNPASIEGRTIAATAGNAIINMLPVLMSINNLPKNYQLVSVSTSALIPGLFAGQFNISTSIVDGIYSTFLSAAATQGKHIYSLNFSDWGINVPAYVVVANNAFLKQNPQAVSGFIKGTVQAVDYSISNPSNAATMMVNHNPGLNQTIVHSAWNTAVTLIKTPYATSHYGMFNMTAIQQAEQLVVQGYGLTQSDLPNLDQIVTNQYVPANQVLP